MSADREDAVAPHSDDEALIQELDRAAELERRIVADVRQRSPAPEELRQVEAALQPAWGARRSTARFRSALVAAGLLAAALLAWRFVVREPRPLPDVPLGGNELQVLAPEGAVDAFTLLRWRTTTQGTPRFSVRVVDAATGTLLLARPDLQASELSLENHDTSTWQRVQVEVDELDSVGEPVKSGRARAWRRSP